MANKLKEKENPRSRLSGPILGAFLLAASLLLCAAQETTGISADQVFARYALFNLFLVKNGSIQANWLSGGIAFWYADAPLWLTLPQLGVLLALLSLLAVLLDRRKIVISL